MNLLEQIDRWAAVFPEAIAHVSDGRTLTYGELRRCSDALAAHLAERLGADRAPIAALGRSRTRNANAAKTSSRDQMLVSAILHAPISRQILFFQHRNQRAYRTGDLGRIRDNLLFFEGRIDQQIKLSGYRIKLGDVEANLRALAPVRDAVVIPVIKDAEAKSLAAFVVLGVRNEPSDFELAQTIRKQLGERLPAYMLPRKFVFLDAFPMTANGKADRARLAESL